MNLSSCEVNVLSSRHISRLILVSSLTTEQTLQWTRSLLPQKGFINSVRVANLCKRLWNQNAWYKGRYSVSVQNYSINGCGTWTSYRQAVMPDTDLLPFLLKDLSIPRRILRHQTMPHSRMMTGESLPVNGANSFEVDQWLFCSMRGWSSLPSVRHFSHEAVHQRHIILHHQICTQGWQSDRVSERESFGLQHVSSKIQNYCFDQLQLSVLYMDFQQVTEFRFLQ